MSKQYEMVMDSFIRKPNRDGPDYGLLLKLSEVEKKEAEKLFIENLDGPYMYEYSKALGYLNSNKSIGYLLSIMRNNGSYYKIGAASAILMMGENREAEACLIRLAQRRLFCLSSTRVEAILGLENSKSKESLSVLRKCVDDRDCYVAFNALDVLARSLGLVKECDQYRKSSDGYYEGPRLSLDEYAKIVKGKCDQILKELNEDTPKIYGYL